MIMTYVLLHLWSMLCICLFMVVYSIVQGIRFCSGKKAAAYAITSGIMAVIFAVILWIVYTGGNMR